MFRKMEYREPGRIAGTIGEIVSVLRKADMWGETYLLLLTEALVQKFYQYKGSNPTEG